MSITLKLDVPGKIIPKLRVLLSQKISIINNLQIFSQSNKMLFISNGMILPYNMTIEQCKLKEGDIIYALKINENDSFLVDILSTNECVCFSQLRNRIPIFGSSYEANLTSINKIIAQSQNPKEKILIHCKSAFKEVARIHDIRLMRKENCKKAWRKQINAFLNKKSDDFVCNDPLNINYESPKEPCCEALPLIL